MKTTVQRSKRRRKGGKGLTRQKDHRNKFWKKTLKACAEKRQGKEEKQVFK